MSPRKHVGPEANATTRKRNLSVDEMKVAYEEACRQGQDAYRLFYACKITQSTKDSYWLIKYAQELQQNLMHFKAEKGLLEVLEKEPDNLECILTLAQNYLERFKLDDAEGMFRKSIAIQESEAAKQGMETIIRLRNEKLLTDEDRWHKETWDEMERRWLPFKGMTEEQYRRAAAEFLAKCFLRG